MPSESQQRAIRTIAKNVRPGPAVPIKTREVPQYRDRLIHDWGPSGPFPNLSVQIAQASAGRHKYTPFWELHAAQRASLWYVSSEMSELLDSAAPSLPPTPLAWEMCPDAFGLVIFETPLLGLDAETGERETHTSAYLWGPAHVEGIDVLGISTYMLIVPSRDSGLQPRLAPTGTVTWPIGAPPDARVPFPLSPGPAPVSVPDGHKWTETGRQWRDSWRGGPKEGYTEPPEDAQRSMVEDRRRVMGLWLLSAMPRLTDVKRDSLDRAHVKRSQRANPPQDPAIRIVTLRAKPAPGPDEPSEGGRVYRHRWVTRGHFYEQAYGPRWSLRRPAYRNPALKGPKGAPFLVNEKVTAWTRK